MDEAQGTAVEVADAFRKQAAAVHQRLLAVRTEALAVRADVVKLALKSRAYGGPVQELAELVDEDLRVHDHGENEAHFKCAIGDLEELLELIAKEQTA